MGNQICCEQNHAQEQINQLTILHKNQEQPPVNIPTLHPNILAYLDKQKPFINQISQNPQVVLYGQDVYQGKTDGKGRPHGYGRMYHKNGAFFIGHFYQGKADGEGHYIKTDGTYYRGQFKDNKANDQLGFYWSEKFKYKGGFKDNNFHGSAEEQSLKHTFKGFYQNGRKIKGNIKWKENDQSYQYQGQMNNQGKPHGQGFLKSQKGIYKGTFFNGQKHGKGEFKNKQTGITYIGDYKYNIKQGYGKILNCNGSIAYQGQFKDGLPHGDGKIKKGDKLVQCSWDYGIDKQLI